MSKSTALSAGPSRAIMLALFFGIFIAHSAISLFIGLFGWDDGAITLAYARTFAATGRIALTPTSEVVEGFSSPFWFSLTAATDRILPLNFHGIILSSQLWTAFFAALGAIVLYALLHRLGTALAVTLSALVFLSGAFLNETMNGMEMTALTALALGIAWLVERDAKHSILGIAILAGCAPWVRLESAGYMLAAAVALLILTRKYRFAIALIVGAVASLAVLTALRLAIFEAWLPNTMLAKQSAPYTVGTSLSDRFSSTKMVVKELVYVLMPALVLAVLAAVGGRTRIRPLAAELTSRVKARTIDPVVVFAGGYVGGVAVFNLAIGANWGYLGRMEESAIPLAVVAVAFCIPPSRTHIGLPRIAALTGAMLLLIAYGLNITQIEGRIHKDERAAVTPASYRETGEAMDHVRTELGLENLRVLTPDIGGSSLCCSQLTILDLALLANSELARDGYPAMGSYLEKQRPDLIETHSDWSTASGIYDIEFFRDNYSPIVANNMWFYLRNDLSAGIEHDCIALAPSSAANLRYRGSDVDERYIESAHFGPVCQLR